LKSGLVQGADNFRESDIPGIHSVGCGSSVGHTKHSKPNIAGRELGPSTSTKAALFCNHREIRGRQHSGESCRKNTFTSMTGGYEITSILTTVMVFVESSRVPWTFTGWFSYFWKPSWPSSR